MSTNERASINNSSNAHEHSSLGLDERAKKYMNANCDEFKESGQTWHSFLNALLWVCGIVGWGAIAYIYYIHPSFP